MSQVTEQFVGVSALPQPNAVLIKVMVTSRRVLCGRYGGHQTL